MARKTRAKPTDPEVARLNARRGRLWHNLSAVQRAAIANPNGGQS